jgi:anti-sigma factor ChrR (cupin superfamily)
LELIHKISKDSVPAVSIVACEILAKFGNENQQSEASEALLKLADQRETDFYASIHALNAIERVDKNIGFPKEKIRALPGQPNWKGRGTSYVQQMLDRILN